MSHPHSIYDTDPHFKIDPDTRVIQILSKSKPVIVQGDHKSERFTFELPRYVEGHDMSLCDSVKVHYINIGTNDRIADVHSLTDLQISPDSEDVVICSWLLTRDATSLNGTLNFAISFSCSENGEVIYAWGTLPYTDITIGQGINNSDAIAKEYADILQQWEEELFRASTEGVENIYTARDGSLVEIENVKNDAVTEIEDKCDQLIGIDSAMILGLSEDINALNGIIKTLSVDIINVRKRFWNSFTNNGRRTDYTRAFDHVSWQKQIFDVAQLIKPKIATSMFLGANGGGVNATVINTTLEEHIKQFGGSLDWSDCTDYNSCFSSCTWFWYLNELDFRKVITEVGTHNIGSWCGIRRIGVMKFSEDGSTPISHSMFANWTVFGSEGTTSIEGTLGYSINLSQCPKINVETMKQFITHLANYKGTEKEATREIKFTSAKWEELEASGKPFDDGLTDDETLKWQEYVTDILGWNI